ncbi:hypothetical protein CYG48_05120 [Neorhizobium sp. SOG26]|uniref:hypothetical protein n=1 Tax=Neorhizobium sp. SOG26 TaxID=2060726 RepID=UPI000E577BA8|nr:hypothetical protein [Neorhizobium sp. SOG26]AXV15135.1 hypothetical protein CYG48_05120 [Neorhizobium sp. SOG26]
MDELIQKLGEFWGPAGVICALEALVIVYLYRGREADRAKYDAALKESADEGKETLKLVIPIVQKMTATLDVTLPVLMSKINGGNQ